VSPVLIRRERERHCRVTGGIQSATDANIMKALTKGEEGNQYNDVL